MNFSKKTFPMANAINMYCVISIRDITRDNI